MASDGMRLTSVTTGTTGETQASFHGHRFPAHPVAAEKTCLVFSVTCTSLSFFAQPICRRCGAPSTWGGISLRCQFFARYGGRRTAFFGVPYGFDEAVSQMGRGQIPPSGPPFAEHPCGGAPCGALCGVRGRVPERGVRVLPAVRSQCGSHRAVTGRCGGTGNGSSRRRGPCSRRATIRRKRSCACGKPSTPLRTPKNGASFSCTSTAIPITGLSATTAKVFITCRSGSTKPRISPSGN